MNRKAILCTLSLFAASSLFASSPEKKGVASINRQTAEAHIEFLASDELKGREAGTPEGRIAGHYIVSVLKSLGVQPLGESYYHPFEVYHAERQIKNQRWQVEPDSIAKLKDKVHQKLDLNNILAVIPGKKTETLP